MARIGAFSGEVSHHAIGAGDPLGDLMQNRLRATAATMFVVSFGIILFELLLTRLFGVVLFAQFAHLALALALLGISVGAIAQHLKPSLLPDEGLEERLAWVVVAQAVLTLVAVFATVEFPVTVQFEEPPTTYQERSGVKDDLLDPFWFGLLLPILTAPFVAAGLAFSGVFQRRKDHIGIMYGADLIGGAVGAVAFIPLLNLLSGPDLVFVIVAVTLGVAALLFFLSGKKNAAAGALLGMVGGLVFTGVGLLGGELIHIRYAAGYAEENVTYSNWTALARLSIHEDDKRGSFMLLDNTSASEVVKTKKRAKRLAQQAANRSVVHQLHDPGARIAILAASAGPEVAVAQHYGHHDIVAIDIAGELFDIVAERFPDAEANPYTHGNTERVKSDGRAAILHAQEPFDVIQMVHANLWSSAGLLSNAWSPSLLETEEAFETYLDKLTDDGTLSFGRGSHTPNLVRSAAAALRGRGADPAWKHILYVVADSHLMLVKKRPWTKAERDHAVKVLQRYRFQRIIIDPTAQKLSKEGRGILSAEAVMTDDRPYLDRPDMVLDTLSSAVGMATGQDTGALATLYRSVVLQAAFVLVAGGLFIIVPFLGQGRSQVRDLQKVPLALLYVCGLGYGYLAVETVLVHELVLFVGHPTYAVTVVILTMLLFSGIGSVLTERIPMDKGVTALRGIIATVLVLGLIQAFVVPGILHAFALGLPPAVRMALTFVVLAPLGLLMGMPFPLAMRLLPKDAAGLVPWAWALNGWTSVVASLVTVVVSRIYGYSTAFGVALMAYAMALVLAGFIPQVLRRDATS